ncbi:Hypothetical predicted protein [Mytilus galloprovincialis]|uniref:Uncharacterized protein n=1 Tax=Mytilus galloprovincialis TaxID=29158 RepID=A0A8B6GF21_MYTGA|nr:Hypothetical predicted protein [Mytilus galloprovincialis]
MQSGTTYVETELQIERHQKQRRKGESALGNSICEAFDNENVVVTPTLRSDVFTTAAMDNIDHNPSSTTADKSLHDTAISLFQQPRGSNTFEDYFNDILMPYIHDQLRFVSRLEVVGD